jgi:ABC-type glycerol-3-phosphate transport system permease component
MAYILTHIYLWLLLCLFFYPCLYILISMFTSLLSALHIASKFHIRALKTIGIL